MMLEWARALANDKRLEILALLKEPARYFSAERFDEENGVCGLYIAEEIGISAPTASAHLKILQQAQLVDSCRIGKFTYFKRSEAGLRELARLVGKI